MDKKALKEVKIAAVRVRGVRKVKPNIVRTLELLRLERPNHCVVMDASPQTLGMLSVVKDYVAFGVVGEDTILGLLEKRGEKGGRPLSESAKEAEIKAMAKEIAAGKRVRDFADPVFRLHPPRKGYGDTKSHYPRGELGRRPDMAVLIKRMM